MTELTPELLLEAVKFAKTFGKEYNELEDEIIKMRQKIQEMKRQLSIIDSFLKGNLNIKGET